MSPLVTIENKLKERIKELSCLYSVTSIIMNCNYDKIEDCIEKIAYSLKDAFQYSEDTCITIKTDEYTISTLEYPKKMPTIQSQINVFNTKIGELTAGYNNNKLTENSFLYEEKQLLEKVSIEIGNLLERKKIQENEVLLKRKVERADRISILGEITAGIAHELNTPLANILGFAELLKTNFIEDKQTTKDLDKIINSAIFSREVVKKLMYFACEIPQQITVVNMNNTITEAINLLEPSFKKKNIKYVLKFQKPTIQLNVDSIQLIQVIFNMVLNAIYFSPENGEIQIETLDNKNNVILNISDQGPGIKHAIADKIFNPFFTTKPVGDGVGLGLSVVHGIIKSHKGTITHLPNSPKGTIFSIKFPKI
ncbi:sensor histidine kinase [Lutibacter maritimus]|uniref:histidine kinase n=1 Tax=Lutibacter maritimus TaxID=593133 RepID=A0A1I6QGC7_9FLAO|nr:HAMP domain-containing sensor histidine kinase [Lutibacter maritimus]SFS51350.1 His Kinase A (phospho-acceptor) domain-containing protein [Lutibacter maritimus]